MKNLAICFLTFVALNGCVKKQANPLDPKDLFDVVEKVEGSVITELPCMPSESIIIDSLLIFVTRYCDYNFAVLNLNNFEIVRRFGRQGKGPGEYYTGNLIGRVDDSRYFQTFDVLNKMHTYNLDSLVDYASYQPTRTMDNLPLRDFMNLARLSDSLYVGLGLFEQGMIGIISLTMQ